MQEAFFITCTNSNIQTFLLIFLEPSAFYIIQFVNMNIPNMHV